jgi:hypothetical protein
MVVINDNAEVDYVFNHPNVRIINHKERFPSIAAKFEWGCKMCKHQYIYRLDDDDLLAPEALENVIKDINDVGECISFQKMNTKEKVEV